jgi:hypothetical protein
MKGYFKPQYPTKWFMFGGLCATLGFSLSMNPQHFNNIARWSPNDPLNAVHFASEIELENKKTQTVVGKDGTDYVIEFGQVPNLDLYIGKIKTAAVGIECSWCEVQLAAQTSDSAEALIQFTLEVLKMTQAQSAEAQAQSGQQASAQESIVEKYAKACERDKSLSCYQTQIVKLSEDKDAKQEDVLKFFREHLRAELREALTTPVVQLTPTGLGGFFTEDNREISEDAHQVITELMEKLHKDSGKSTRAELMRLKASYFSEQARYAQSLIQQSFTAQDPNSMAILFNMGNVLINQLQGQVQFATAELHEAIANIPGIEKERTTLAAYRSALNSSFASPVGQMFTSLNQDRRNAVIPALGGRGTEITTPGGSVAGNLLDMRQIPRFAGDLGSQLLAPSATPNFSGNVQVVPSSGPSSGVAPGYNLPPPPMTTWPQQTQPGFQGAAGYQTPGFNPNGFNPQGNQQFGVNPVNTRYR